MTVFPVIRSGMGSVQSQVPAHSFWIDLLFETRECEAHTGIVTVLKISLEKFIFYLFFYFLSLCCILHVLKLINEVNRSVYLHFTSRRHIAFLNEDVISHLFHGIAWREATQACWDRLY